MSPARYFRSVALSSTMATVVIKSVSAFCVNCDGIAAFFPGGLLRSRSMTFYLVNAKAESDKRRIYCPFDSLRFAYPVAASGTWNLTTVPPPQRDSTANLPPIFSNREERFLRPWPLPSTSCSMPFPLSATTISRQASAKAMRNSTSVASECRTMLFSPSLTAIKSSCRNRPSRVTGGNDTGTLKRQLMFV